MKHLTHPDFWSCYERLPQALQDLADKNFQLLKRDPEHPSLHLKKVARFWSVRVGRSHRALAIRTEEGLVWFWIGNHGEYDQLIKS